MAAWPRFKMYGVPGIFRQALADFVTGRIRAGDDVAILEQQLCRLSGARYAISMPQGRVGIYLTLKALVRRSGRKKIILSPYTIYDVVNMIVSAGGVPVFADVDPNNGNLDPAEVARLVDDDTAAVLATHLHGLACDMRELQSVCQSLDIPLVEDAAQAFGGRWENQPLGTVGKAGVFSFGRAKNVNCFFGGAVVTDDLELAQSLRNEISGYRALELGRLAKRVLVCLAYTIAMSKLLFPPVTHPLYRRMALTEPKRGAELLSTERRPILRTSLPETSKRQLTPMQARCAIGQFPLLDAQQEQRKKLAAIYRAGLADLPAVRLPVELYGSDNVYLSFPIQVPDRVALQQHMFREGRDVVIQHIGNCSDYDCFADFHRSLPIARTVAASVLLLPTYPEYPTAEALANIAAIRSFFG